MAVPETVERQTSGGTSKVQLTCQFCSIGLHRTEATRSLVVSADGVRRVASSVRCTIIGSQRAPYHSERGNLCRGWKQSSAKVHGDERQKRRDIETAVDNATLAVPRFEVGKSSTVDL
jgi:hypothetical protein